MIKKRAHTGISLLALLVAATACAQPSLPEPTALPGAGEQVAPPVVEIAPVAVVETATATPLPTATEPVIAATETAEPTPMVVEMPEKETPVVEPQPTDAIAGPTDEQQRVLDGLPSLGDAPELRNDVWFNSEPLRLTDLRGQVVLLDMWTFG